VPRAEFDLLLACARWDASEKELAIVRARASVAVDWPACLDLMRWHRLIPHAHRTLGAAGASVPAGCAAILQEESIAIAARSLARAQQLTVLLRALGYDGVRAMPFKGPSLSLAAYGELGVRDGVDLDIVVRPDDVDRARATLLRLGYAPSSAMSPTQERTLQRSFGHFVYDAPGDAVKVELHWRFAAQRYPWSMSVEDVLSRASMDVAVGFGAASPDQTDQILLQVMHGTRHQWERLEWLVALVQLLTRADADESSLIERASHNESARALQVALRLARDLLGMPLSLQLGALADEPGTAARAAQIVRALEGGAASPEDPYRLNMQMMDRTGDRVRYIALSVFSPTMREWELVRLPGRLAFLYYPIRIARVLARRTRMLLFRR
jgi:hypothetical protein